jgi:hypothetical protein
MERSQAEDSRVELIDEKAYITQRSQRFVSG